MPIGIVSQEEFIKETNGTNHPIDNDDNSPARSGIIETPKPLGRGNTPDVPAEIRNVIAQEALLGASSKQLSKEFNVSPQSVNAYKNGATSLATYNEGDKKLRRANNIFRDRIVKRAGRLSLTALDSISVDDFKSASLRDKSAVAKEMASVVRDMSIDSNDDRVVNNTQIIVHAPAMRKESDYIDGIVSVD